MYQPIFEPKERRSCIQVYISWTSYINLLISIVALSFGTYEGIRKKDLWSKTDFDWNKVLVFFLVTGSVLLFITSIAGIIGGRKKNKCCIFFFQIFSIALSFSFIIVAFVFLGLTDSHIVDIKNADCITKNNIFKYSQQAYNQADTFFCTSKCPCKVTDEDVKDYMQSHPRREELEYQFDDLNGATKVQDCQGYKNYFSDSDVKKQIGWVQSLEEVFDCTGMCTKPSNIYFFSNINHGIPDTATCKVKFQEFVQSYGRVAYIVGFVVGSYLLFNAILAFCLCCKNKRQGATIYERFAFY
ncbi:hypothetical protein ABPG74_010813 [Tetrahymena malaccensis]